MLTNVLVYPSGLVIADHVSPTGGRNKEVLWSPEGYQKIIAKDEHIKP